MADKNLYKSYECDIVMLDEFAASEQHNNFFELIYILEGNGKQFVNGNEFTYKPGNLFLLTPQDSYSFTVAEPTRYVFVRFNDSFVRTEKAKEYDNGEWMYRMEYVLENASHQPGCILKNQPDKPVVRQLVEGIIREQEGGQLFHKRIIRQLVDTLITIVARNISLRLPEKFKAASEQPVRDILFYIHQNIYESDKLKTERLSKEFGVGESYLARYFKKHTGESLQRYITNYKMKLVETRLLHSGWRISEIAYELNFADESHLNKVFKKHFGENPSDFRRRMRVMAKS